MEQEFADKVINRRARLLCSAAIDEMKLELIIRGLPSTRCGFIVLFTYALFKQLVEWINEYVKLRGVNVDIFSLF